MPTVSVCLAMIVKNEEHVLARAIASALPFVDTAVIVDTGSTDATEAIAVELVDRMQGLVVRHPWKGFGDARTKALDLARGRADYALVLDADEVMQGRRPELSASAHAVLHMNQTTSFRTQRYFRTGDGWLYRREIHERPTRGDQEWDDGTTLSGVFIETEQDGARSKDPEKLRKDVATIERLMLRDPGDSNLLFFLAQTLRNAGDDEAAATKYLLRAMYPGPKEEIYISLLEAGRALGRLQRLDEAEQALLRARACAPYRCEAPALLAYLYGHIARNMPAVGSMYVENCHYRPGDT